MKKNKLEKVYSQSKCCVTACYSCHAHGFCFCNGNNGAKAMI